MSLLQISIAGAVMILVITVIRTLTINRVPKKTFLILWGAALIRLLIPVSLPSGLSIYSLLERHTPVLTAEPFSVSLPRMVSAGTWTAGAAEITYSDAASEVSTSTSASVSVWGIVWILGMIFCAAFFILSYWRCYREFHISFPIKNDFLMQWLQTHSIHRKMSIRQSDRISSPLTFGVFHPVILMPKKTDWEDTCVLRYVLEHEFVHIQRFDTCSKLLLIVAVCVHWFNPLVWVMYILANRDIELSCDETVIHRFGSNTRASYAKMLISMEERRSGFTPLCNNFSKNAIEERIVAIMKTRKTTMTSLVLAAALVAGTITVFATSAQNEESGSVQPGRNVAVEEGSAGSTRNTAAAQTTEAGTGEAAKPDEELVSVGLVWENDMWYYQEKAVIGMYDANGGIYTNDMAVNDGVYLEIRRDDAGTIAEVAVLTEKQFQEMMDRYMEQVNPGVTVDEATIMSYMNPDDGRTYYSFDDGKTFELLTDEEFQARVPSADVEWWTYNEYKEWLEKEKTELQSIIGNTGWSGGKEFVWTQEKVDETIAGYEEILQDIKNGVMYSKFVDGEDSLVYSFENGVASYSENENIVTR